MVRIDWTVLCDSAFLDNKDRLCIIGIIRRFPVASLPMTLPEVMLVARLADIRPVDEVAITAGVVFPSGRHAARMGSNDVVIEMAGEYILTRLRGISPVLATCRARFAEVQ